MSSSDDSSPPPSPDVRAERDSTPPRPPPSRRWPRGEPRPRVVRRHPLPAHENRMNRGFVVDPAFGGACRIARTCDGKKTCKFRATDGDEPAEHTCSEDRKQRWECALSRLFWGVAERVEERVRRGEELPIVIPEWVDYARLEQDLLERMRHEGPGMPALPLVNSVDYANPRAYWGDDAHGYIYEVAHHLRHPVTDERVFTQAEVDRMYTELSLPDMVREVADRMTARERARLRRRLASFVVEPNADIGRLAGYLPRGDAPGNDGADRPWRRPRGNAPPRPRP